MDETSGVVSANGPLRTLKSGQIELAHRLDVFLARKKAAEEECATFDRLEDKMILSAAFAAAASGSSEEARAMAAKILSKALRAAAEAADAEALDAIVREMDKPARIAAENCAREKRGGVDASTSATPALVALART